MLNLSLMGWDNSTIRIVLFAAVPFLVLVLGILYRLGFKKDKSGWFAMLSILMLIPFAAIFVLLALNPDSNSPKTLELSFYICGNQIVPAESKPESRLLAKDSTLDGSRLKSYQHQSLKEALGEVDIQLQSDGVSLPIDSKEVLSLSNPRYSSAISSTIDNSGSESRFKIPTTGMNFCGDNSPEEQLVSYVFKIDGTQKTYAWKQVDLESLNAVSLEDLDGQCLSFGYVQSGSTGPDRACQSFLQRGLSRCLAETTNSCQIDGQNYQKVTYQNPT